MGVHIEMGGYKWIVNIDDCYVRKRDRLTDRIYCNTEHRTSHTVVQCILPSLNSIQEFGVRNTDFLKYEHAAQ